MKIIFAATLFALFAFTANAQVTTPNTLQNKVNTLKPQPLKIDSSLNLVGGPKPGARLNWYGAPQNEALQAKISALQSSIVVYSRMPVKRVHGTDYMPVAGNGAARFDAGVKRVTVIDPLKPAVPASVAP